MYGFLPLPRFLPCPECGAAVEFEELDEHECNQERFVDYQLRRLRPEIDSFEWELALWLRTPEGRFETFWAAYDRIRGPLRS
jgi:hypothetical protein